MAVGEWDVHGLEKRLSLQQLREWIAYYNIEPFGDEWRAAARVAMFTVASNGVKVQHDMEDRFMPNFRQGGHVQTDAEIEQELAKIPAYLKNN